MEFFKKQLIDLKVGDKVLCCKWYGKGHYDFITKITNKIIYVNENKYKISDGYLIGGNKYQKDYIVIQDE